MLLTQCIPAVAKSTHIFPPIHNWKLGFRSTTADPFFTQSLENSPRKISWVTFHAASLFSEPTDGVLRLNHVLSRYPPILARRLQSNLISIWHLDGGTRKVSWAAISLPNWFLKDRPMNRFQSSPLCFNFVTEGSTTRSSRTKPSLGYSNVSILISFALWTQKSRTITCSKSK